MKKFSEPQKLKIVNLYTVKNFTLSEIIKEFNGDITRHTIYRFLKEHNIPLDRKNGKKHDIIGKTFGYLKVLKMAQTSKSGKANEWRAICECTNCGNNNFDVHPQSLLRGRTTSCGCRRDQYLKNTGVNCVQFTGYKGINGKYWGVINNRANRRDYKFDVDIKFAWDLYVKQNKKCNLSGLPITFAISNRKSSETTASLDRIDSNKGYTKDNVQWVHKEINIMKNVYSQKHFIYLCGLIAEHNLNKNHDNIN